MLAKEFYELKEKYKACMIGGIFFLVILSVFFALGLYMVSRQIIAESYVRTEAVVVDYVLTYERDSDSHSETPVYYDIVEYEFDGVTYTRSCDTAASSYDPPIGDIGKVITIFVNPKNPKDVVFRNSTHAILITACIVIPVVGYVAIVFVFRKAYRIKKTLKEYE